MDGPLDEAARRALTLPETVGLLCEREIARKDERRLRMALSIAKFPFVRDLASFGLEGQPSLDPRQIREDRLLHHSHVPRIRGNSYRLREKRRSGLPRTVPAALREAAKAT